MNSLIIIQITQLNAVHTYSINIEKHRATLETYPIFNSLTLIQAE